jgi:hypothetical protein
MDTTLPLQVTPIRDGETHFKAVLADGTASIMTSTSAPSAQLSGIKLGLGFSLLLISSSICLLAIRLRFQTEGRDRQKKTPHASALSDATLSLNDPPDIPSSRSKAL